MVCPPSTQLYQILARVVGAITIYTIIFGGDLIAQHEYKSKKWTSQRKHWITGIYWNMLQGCRIRVGSQFPDIIFQSKNKQTKVLVIIL